MHSFLLFLMVLSAAALFSRSKLFAAAESNEYDDLKVNDQKVGFIAGDYIIGALLPIRGSFDDDDYACSGIIKEYDGLQLIEAAFLAVDMINKDRTLLPNTTLGIEIRDYCNSVTAATLQTKSFVEKSIPQANNSQNTFSDTLKNAQPPLIGVIGPESSFIAYEVQNLLKVFGITQIGYLDSISDILNNKQDEYEYFWSMTPGVTYATKAIIELLIRYNWTYVSLVYTSPEEVSYGLTGMKQFQQYAAQYKICIGDVIESSALLGLELNADSLYSETIKDKMKSYDKVNVIVCYCSELTMQLLLRALRGRKKFLIIRGNGWPLPAKYLNGYEEEAVGSVEISLKATYVPEFDPYYLTRNLQNNTRNHWFEEFWDCEENDASTECAGINEKANTVKLYYRQNPKVAYVMKSIYVLAHNLHGILEEGCRTTHGSLPLANAFYRTCFRNAMKRVNFTFYNEIINFSSQKLSKIEFDIFNFRKLKNGSYGYVALGKYEETAGYSGFDHKEVMRSKHLRLYDSIVLPENKPMKSICTEKCKPGYAKIYRKDKCCWDCTLCKPLEILVNTSLCVACAEGFMSNGNRTECFEIPVRSTGWTGDDTQSIIALTFSSIGIVLTSVSWWLFYTHRDTPIVRSSTRELCYVMFAGMVLAHSVVFAAIVKPLTSACFLIRVLAPLSFATLYGALLVKTHRIFRIVAVSKKEFPNMNLKFLSLKAQIVITLILVAIEMGFSAFTLVKEPPTPYRKYSEENGTYCANIMCPLGQETLMRTYSFIVILVVLCTYYAAKTRHLPENFRETKIIGFAMYAVCICWIAFIVMYFENELEIITICIGASSNSLIILAFIFFPKLYIILWKPQLNTQVHFTINNDLRSCIGRQKRNMSQVGIACQLCRRIPTGSFSIEFTTTSV